MENDGDALERYMVELPLVREIVIDRVALELRGGVAFQLRERAPLQVIVLQVFEFDERRIADVGITRELRRESDVAVAAVRLEFVLDDVGSVRVRNLRSRT